MPRDVRNAKKARDLTRIPMLEVVSKLERLTYFGDIRWDELNQLFRHKHHTYSGSGLTHVLHQSGRTMGEAARRASRRASAAMAHVADDVASAEHFNPIFPS